VHETYYSNVGTAPNNCQTVITVYDMIQELFPNEFEAQENKLKLKRRAIERADHIICISECTKNDLMRLHGTPANKISLVHLGFDQFAKEEGNNVFSHCFDKPFILYVGQRGGYKNFLGLIKSFASSNKLLNDFDIVAFGGGKFTTAELSLIQSLGFAANQVKQVCGNDDLLGRYYQSAKAFVYPSFYEGFGIPPLEAMAHQCPVISSNKSSMPEVIGIAAEYFDPNVFEDIRLAIENVVYSESRADELRKEGLARLLKFSWKKCTYETLDIYQSLSGNN
jgi:glycosyltransferase involved in cell wall biosynthesis